MTHVPLTVIEHVKETLNEMHKKSFAIYTREDAPRLITMTMNDENCTVRLYSIPHSPSYDKGD